MQTAKGTKQPVHPDSLIRAFVVCTQDVWTPKNLKATILIPVNARALISVPCHFSENNVILICMNSSLLL